MDTYFSRSGRNRTGMVWVLLLIPALVLPACTRKRETTQTQTVTGRVTRVTTSSPDGPLTVVVTTDTGDSTVLHVSVDAKDTTPARTQTYATARSLQVGNRVEATTTQSGKDYEIQTITVTNADMSGMDTSALDTGRTASPPVRSNPTELRISDAGQTFTYHVGDKFTVVLDGNSYPQAQLSFEPGGVITLDSNAPPATAPNYAAEFQAVAPGEAVLRNGTFTVTIHVVS